MFTVHGQSHLLHVSFSAIQILSGASSNDKPRLLLGYNSVRDANFLISLPLPSAHFSPSRAQSSALQR